MNPKYNLTYEQISKMCQDYYEQFFDDVGHSRADIHNWITNTLEELK